MSVKGLHLGLNLPQEQGVSWPIPHQSCDLKCSQHTHFLGFPGGLAARRKGQRLLSTLFWPCCLEEMVLATLKDVSSAEPAQIIPPDAITPLTWGPGGSTPTLSDLLGACGQIIVHPVPQSPHLYHEGVDSILMSLNTSLIYNPVSPCFPEPFRPSPIAWGPIVHYQTDRQTAGLTWMFVNSPTEISSLCLK